MPLFDEYLIVDWSANSKATAKNAPNSIWIGHAKFNAVDCDGRSIPTRFAAETLLEEVILSSKEKQNRIFIGLDFSFGYPVGAAEALTQKRDWLAVWHKFAELFEQDQAAAKDRFDIAEKLNRENFRFIDENGKAGMFWRHSNKCDNRTHLSYTKPNFEQFEISERRIVERNIPRAKSNWELYNPGSVGSQTMLGIASLGRLLRNPEIRDLVAVWPFETDFGDKLHSKNVILAEVYPSAFKISNKYNGPTDRQQVLTLANGFASLDGQDKFVRLLSRPEFLGDADKEVVCREEGWIVGVGNTYSVLVDQLDRNPE